MKRKIASIVTLGLHILLGQGVIMVEAQNTTYITLDSCQHWARQHHPLTDQYPLITEISQLNLENIATHNYPEINLIGKATYQSEVTAIPLEFPGVDLPRVPYDQYNAYVEISQPLTNFKSTALQKAQIQSRQAIQEKEIDVALYQLYDRISSIYFGILLTDAQLEQNRLSQADLRQKTDQLREAKAFGTVMQTDIDQLQAAVLKLSQQELTLLSNRQELLTVLNQFTGQNFPPDTRLNRPALPGRPHEIQRPELELYRLRKAEIDLQKELFARQLKPRIGLFLQGGYGRPALNFLSRDFKPYFLGGIRFQWNISSHYNKNRQFEIWDIRQRVIDTQSETFTFNTRTKLSQYSEMADRYEALIRLDRDIIQLRKSVKETAEAQLDLGTITPLDFLAIFHKEEQARLDLVLHEIQFLQSQYKWLYENGN